MPGNHKIIGFLASILFLLFIAQVAKAQSPQESDEEATIDEVSWPRFGGPDSVDNLLESAQSEKDVLIESSSFEGFFGWKNGVTEKNGFSFGGGYTGNFFTANNSLPGRDDESSGGMLRLFGNWELQGRGTSTTGALNFKLDQRHGYSGSAPNLFALDDLGYVDSFASTFSDEGWRLTNLHWRQSWGNGKVVLITGLLSNPDFFDVYTLGSPWVHFQSLAFTTGAGTISLPGDAALGAMLGGWVNENLYIMGGFEDANSVASDFFESFDTFFSEKEFFKHIEIGWTTSRDRAYIDNFHLSVWHADEREEAGVMSGHGAVLSFTHYINDKWLPFVRAGYAKDGASFLQRSLSAGIAYQSNPIGSSSGHLLGIGLNWGQPNEASFGPGLDNQFGVEAFYRIQVTNEIAITPDIQYLMNPALNPLENSIWVFGLRLRISL